MFGADAAMFMHARVLLTLVGTCLTTDSAGMHHSNDNLFVAAGAANTDCTCCQANIGAVEIEPNALAQPVNRVFCEAGVGARSARLGTRVAFLQTADQRLIDITLHAWVGRDHLSHVSHSSLPGSRMEGLWPAFAMESSC
jgi:hypothetical protein